MHVNGPRNMLWKTEECSLSATLSSGHAGSRTGDDSAKGQLFGVANSHFIPRTNNNRNNNNTSSYYNNNQASSKKRESNLFFNTQFFVYLNMSMSRGFEDGDNNKDLMIML